MADHRERVEPSPASARDCSSACGGDVDQMHAAAAAGRLQRLGEDRRASRRCRSPSSTTAARATDPIRRAVDDLARVRAQQPALRARDAIPRQPADRLEQAEPERVVEILRRQLPRRQREVVPHVGGEIAISLSTGSWHARDRVMRTLPRRTERRVDVGIVAPGTSCGMSAESARAPSPATRLSSRSARRRRNRRSTRDTTPWRGTRRTGRRRATSTPSRCRRDRRRPTRSRPRMAAGRLGIPLGEIEDAVRRVRRLVAPRMRRSSPAASVRGALELRFRRQPAPRQRA